MEFALSLGWMAFVSWLIFRAYRQRNLLPAPDAATPALTEPPHVSVIIPARNEASNLAQCLNALLDQDYRTDRLSILVVDDNSTDDTFDIAASVARRAPHLRLASSPPLPPRWVGKPHACSLGARMAGAEDDWLCFIDADVRAERRLISTAVQVASTQHLDVLSLAPRQRLGSFAERLIMPCGLYLMAFCQELATVQSQDSDTVTASGQFMLVRRPAYDSIGGHAAVRDTICEDVALAMLIKKAGGRVMLQDGKSLLSARMYTGWSDLWTGLSKNLVEMLGGPTATLITAALVLLLSWASVLLPVMDGVWCGAGVSGSCTALIPALAGTGAALGLHIAGALYFRIPFWYGLLFPLGYTVGACLAMESLRRHWRGGIVWKGRSYP